MLGFSRKPIGENNGNSYMLFTAWIVTWACVFTAIDQAANSKATHIIFTINAVFSSLLAIANAVALYWRRWVGQAIEISPNVPPIKPFSLIPWRHFRILDVFLGWNFAASQLILVFWVWDHSPNKIMSFSFCLRKGCHNIWGAWASAINQSFQLFVTSSTDLEPISVGAVTFTWIYVACSFIVVLFILATVIDEGKDIDRRNRQAEHAARLRAVSQEEGTTASLPIKGMRKRVTYAPDSNDQFPIDLS